MRDTGAAQVAPRRRDDEQIARSGNARRTTARRVCTPHPPAPTLGIPTSPSCSRAASAPTATRGTIPTRPDYRHRHRKPLPPSLGTTARSKLQEVPRELRGFLHLGSLPRDESLQGRFAIDCYMKGHHSQRGFLGEAQVPQGVILVFTVQTMRTTAPTGGPRWRAASDPWARPPWPILSPMYSTIC